MQWEAEALVLAARPHGESSAIVDVFSREYGRFAGLVRGGNSRRLRPILQPGNMVVATWRARLSEHLGTMTVDAGRAHAAEAMADAKALAGLPTHVPSTAAIKLPPMKYMMMAHQIICVPKIGLAEAKAPIAKPKAMECGVPESLMVRCQRYLVARAQPSRGQKNWRRRSKKV